MSVPLGQLGDDCSTRLMAAGHVALTSLSRRPMLWLVSISRIAREFFTSFRSARFSRPKKKNRMPTKATRRRTAEQIARPRGSSTLSLRYIQIDERDDGQR